MQLVRLSKPRSGAKYSLIGYFFAGNRSLSQPCLGGIGAIGLVTARGPTNTGTGRKGIAFRYFDAHQHIIGTERHLQVQAFSTRNVSRSSAQADQFQDGVRCI
jgi:hypothetical protein